MKKKIHIKYFALLKEEAGKDMELFQTAANTAEELFFELSGMYNFSLNSNQIRVSINEEFRELSSPIAKEDSVVFIPPVAGG